MKTLTSISKIVSVAVLSMGASTNLAFGGWSADGTNTYLNPTTSCARIGNSSPNWWTQGRLFINLPQSSSGVPYAGIWVQSQSSQYGIHSSVDAGGQPGGTAIGAFAMADYSTAISATAALNNTTCLYLYHGQANGKALIVDQGRTGIGTLQPTCLLDVSNGLFKVDNQTNKVLATSSLSTSDVVLTSTYAGTDYSDHIAIQGTSVPQPYYGIGGWFTGGYIGMHGEAWGAGAGRRIGGQFVATGGTTNRAIEATVNSNTGDDWAGWFNGRLWSTAGYLPSDDKLKKEQTPLEGAIEKVMKLKPVSYFYRTEEYAGMSLPLEKQNGLIAQDLETVFPELVCETAISPQKKGPKSTQTEQIETIKGVNYLALIPVLARAIQEQQQTILNLEKEIRNLENIR